MTLGLRKFQNREILEFVQFLEVLAVVHYSVVDDLPHQGDWALRAELVGFGHVDIIYEQDHGPTGPESIKSHSQFRQSRAHDVVLETF